MFISGCKKIQVPRADSCFKWSSRVCTVLGETELVAEARHCDRSSTRNSKYLSGHKQKHPLWDQAYHLLGCDSGYRRFGGMYFIHFQCRTVTRATTKQAISKMQAICSSERSTRLYGVTLQNALHSRNSIHRPEYGCFPSQYHNMLWLKLWRKDNPRI
jgi:hypothetical protein